MRDRPRPRAPISVPPPVTILSGWPDWLVVVLIISGIAAVVLGPTVAIAVMEPCAEYVSVPRNMVATDGTPVVVYRSVCLAWKPGRAP